VPCSLPQYDPPFRNAFKFSYRYHCLRVICCLLLQCSRIDSSGNSGMKDLRLTAIRPGSPAVLVPLPQQTATGFPETSIPTHQTHSRVPYKIFLKRPYPPKYHKLKKKRNILQCHNFEAHNQLHKMLPCNIERVDADRTAQTK
jgi:hypothetical protein